ncbi:hypothetical protein BHYA_0330g00090 [Botrytis hyacinthi]|uniref:Uncharacterized protein n=1 Tax=Botrytis hyacinthi TaxID=278943 RepID=A0A4Z1G5V2_9HELO|nr:hypothetical protein BHYA_0330g00090 [Botrytis hyacinthi]
MKVIMSSLDLDISGNAGFRKTFLFFDSVLAGINPISITSLQGLRGLQAAYEEAVQHQESSMTVQSLIGI